MSKHHRPPPTRGQLSMGEFARLVHQGGAAPLDRCGTPIKIGHLMTYKMLECDPAYEVVDVSPVMDPRHPGMARITITATSHLTLPVNQRSQSLQIIGALPPKETHQDETPNLDDEPADGGEQPADEATAPPSGIVLTDGADDRARDPEAPLAPPSLALVAPLADDTEEENPHGEAPPVDPRD